MKYKYYDNKGFYSKTINLGLFRRKLRCPYCNSLPLYNDREFVIGKVYSYGVSER